MCRLLFPIFLPLTLWMWGAIFLASSLTDWDHVNGTGPSNSGLVYLMGAGVILPINLVFQLTIGWFLLWVMRKVKNTWSFAALGGVSGLVLALSSMWLLRMPGEKCPDKVVLMFLLVFIPPLAAGCALTFRLLKPRDDACPLNAAGAKRWSMRSRRDPSQ